MRQTGITMAETAEIVEDGVRASSNAVGVARPRMRDVAALAGVGIKTVSRVVKDEPGVSEVTRQKLLEAAKGLNYQLDTTAQSLRRASRQTLSAGLLLPSVANPFHGQIHRALGDVLASHGIAVLAASLDDDTAREEELVKAFLRRRVDGLA